MSQLRKRSHQLQPLIPTKITKMDQIAEDAMVVVAMVVQDQTGAAHAPKSLKMCIALLMKSATRFAMFKIVKRIRMLAWD